MRREAMTIETDEHLQCRVLAASGNGPGSALASLVASFRGHWLDDLAHRYGLFRECPLEPLERLAYALVPIAMVASVIDRWEAMSPLCTGHPEAMTEDRVEVVCTLGRMVSTAYLRFDDAHRAALTFPEQEVDNLFEAVVFEIGGRLIREWLPPEGTSEARALLEQAHEHAEKARRADEIGRRLARAEADLADALAMLAEEGERSRRFCEDRDEARRSLAGLVEALSEMTTPCDPSEGSYTPHTLCGPSAHVGIRELERVREALRKVKTDT